MILAEASVFLRIRALNFHHCHCYCRSQFISVTRVCRIFIEKQVPFFGLAILPGLIERQLDRTTESKDQGAPSAPTGWFEIASMITWYNIGLRVTLVERYLKLDGGDFHNSRCHKHLRICLITASVRKRRHHSVHYVSSSLIKPEATF